MTSRIVYNHSFLRIYVSQAFLYQHWFSISAGPTFAICRFLDHNFFHSGSYADTKYQNYIVNYTFYRIDKIIIRSLMGRRAAAITLKHTTYALSTLKRFPVRPERTTLPLSTPKGALQSSNHLAGDLP